MVRSQLILVDSRQRSSRSVITRRAASSDLIDAVIIVNIDHSIKNTVQSQVSLQADYSGFIGDNESAVRVCNVYKYWNVMPNSPGGLNITLVTPDCPHPLPLVVREAYRYGLKQTIDI